MLNRRTSPLPASCVSRTRWLTLALQSLSFFGYNSLRSLLLRQSSGLVMINERDCGWLVGFFSDQSASCKSLLAANWVIFQRGFRVALLLCFLFTFQLFTFQIYFQKLCLLVALANVTAQIHHNYNLAAMNLNRQEFPFPYTPYPSQVEFMKCLYSALDTGRLAIMESPTGTVSRFELKFD